MVFDFCGTIVHTMYCYNALGALSNIGNKIRMIWGESKPQPNPKSDVLTEPLESIVVVRATELRDR